MTRVNRRLARYLLAVMAILVASTARSGDRSREADHARIQNEVVPISSKLGVTDAVVENGDWHDPAIWNNGVVPAAGARTLIPGGFSVTFSGEASLDWVRLEGTLTFDAKADSTLRLNTLFVDMDGLLKIGTPDCPAAGEVLIEFNDTAPTDWTQLGHGLVSLGEVSIWGLEKSPFVEVARNPRAGDSSVALAAIPKGWQVGDTIIFPGVAPPRRLNAKYAANPDPDPLFRDQHELRKITAINGRIIAFDSPLTQDLHWQLPDDGKLVVAILTRNVVLRSANPSVARRGHVMLMQGPNQIGYCLLKDLGRTATESHVTDPRTDENNTPISATVENIRGRYSLHLHKLGPLIKNRIEGVVAWGGLKWGIVNHGSNADFLDCAAVDIQGSGFATENGVELGSFRRCLSIFNRGAGVAGRNETRKEGFSGQDLAFRNDKARHALVAPVGMDWGQWGYGFWLQGPMVAVEDCTSYGSQREAFAWSFQPMGTDWEGKPCTFPLELLPAEWRTILSKNSKGVARTRVPIQEVPTHPVGNRAVGGGAGLGVYYSEARKCGGSSLKHSAAYNCGLPLGIYSPNDGWLFENLSLKFHPSLIGSSLSSAATNHYSGTTNLTFRDLQIENYKVGIQVPNHGTTIVDGPNTKIVCVNGIVIDDADVEQEFVKIDLGPEQFGGIDQEIINRTYNKAKLRNGVPQYSIYLAGKAKDIFTPLNALVEWRGYRVYFPASARDYRLPDGRTSLEVFKAEGRAPHGILAPSDAVKVDGVYGVLGAPGPEGRTINSHRKWKPDWPTRTANAHHHALGL